MLSCIPKSVLSSAQCTENPAGVSNHMYVVPFDSDHIASVIADDEKNQYVVTPAGGASAALQGIRIDFKSQTGQATSEDNGTGKGWSASLTGRVEQNIDQMAHTSRILHNSNKYLYFIATGRQVDGKPEYIMVGNENGEVDFTVAGDTGVARTDDHGLTFTITCGFMVYPQTKFVGTIEQEDAE